MKDLSSLHVECAKLQNEIEDYLALKGSSLIFEYREFEGKIRLDLITINPRHNQSFLFHTVVGHDKVDSLKKMMDYISTYKEKESSYTIQWIVKGNKELNTSYFRAKNMYDALDKLYYGRDMNQITVFSVVLNPVS